ncbi:hypothetical protein NEFER03_1720 [Nematocida sp. LUAm3]|nr:hypothetical protein NEFER03_1720 [Nematocida sp. LUAm3]KAI5175710.1 hypothetical protein NEFER02_1597 [Nematocida sp. LUAm2]KAI5178616.1 hypothetical protein NEFER01_1752 [Nematocida sp. LUAm1]
MKSFPVQFSGKPPMEISSKKERKRKEQESTLDPRFFSPQVDPLKLADNYNFLYRKEKEILEKSKLEGKDIRDKLSRMHARENLIKMKKLEKERKELEWEMVKEGKKPYYLSRKQQRLVQAIETAKEKGVDRVVSRIKKKERAKEYKSRETIGH